MVPSPVSERTDTGHRWPTVLSVAAWGAGALLLKWPHPALYLACGGAVAAALWVGRRQPAGFKVLVLLALVLPAVLGWQRWKETRLAEENAAEVRALVSAEETILTLTRTMGDLSRGLLELELPTAEQASAFASPLRLRDLADGPPAAEGPAGGAGLAGVITAGSWPLQEEVQDSGAPALWQPLLGAVEYFEFVRVYLIEGDHPGGREDEFDAKAGFAALARMKEGGFRSLHGKMKLKWKRPADAAGDDPDSWKITAWLTESLTWEAGSRLLFSEVLDEAVPPGEAARLRRSAHQEATVKYYRDGQVSPHPYFAPISANQKEGVSVADIDGDGLDDIFIGVRLGKNLLLRNQGDGSFREEAVLRGLDLTGHTTCALFADFDNDGDVDAMLGRSLLKATYLENEGGWFRQLPVPPHFPMAVISMAAADYNGDGLLDVYMCTYRPAAPLEMSPAGGVRQEEDAAHIWPEEFFDPAMAREYRRREAEHRERVKQEGKYPEILDQMGPPNVLLVNRGGGRFEVAPENASVQVWRNSMQAAWNDFDGDGDPDLYVANDWGPDNLLRNDGERGFTDITEEAGTLAYGFAMGASWGDYDNDGRDDLYVSNMYSKAGRRITARVPALRRAFAESAEGNWLYRQTEEGRFALVSGQEPPALTVAKAGWSWGGHFTDFDNDGWLDLYVLSGYFTAPKELSSELDL